MPSTIICPYCGSEITVPTPLASQERGLMAVCEKCHRPIAVYPGFTFMQLHEDRSIKAVAVEVKKYVEGVCLEVMESPLTRHQEIQLPEGKSMIGQHNADSDTDLQILTGDLDLARNHAILWLKKDGTLLVQDNASRSGTFVNGIRLKKGDWMRLNPGDVLLLGATTCIVHLPEDEDAEPWF
ncbi:MAG: FHA domain-containing protein [Bacteroidales bacterium]|nr:FHA domain-containing protein [Bacteroidales bacterium]